MAKFCSNCGAALADNANNCANCGASAGGNNAGPMIINIENKNTNANANFAGMGHAKNKWVTFLLWFFLGFLGAHKFYEGKIGMGILYLFTGGFFGIGLFIDFFTILFKPTTYYV